MKGIGHDYDWVIGVISRAATEFALADPDITDFQIRVGVIGVHEIISLTFEFGSWRCQKTYDLWQLNKIRSCGVVVEELRAALNDLCYEARKKGAKTRDPNRLPG